MGYGRRSAFLLLTSIVVAGVVAASVYTLWRLRVEAIDRHSNAAAIYARAFEDHLTQSLNVIDLTLSVIDLNLSNIRHSARSAVALTEALRHAPYLRSLALLDAGDAIFASSDFRDIGIRIARGEFLPSPTAPAAILRVGPPWAGRDFHDALPTNPEQPAAPEQQTLIPVLRDIALGRDTWSTLVAAVNTDFFLNYYGSVLAANVGTVELLRYDGLLLLSTDPARKPGSRDNNDMLASRIAATEFGQFEQARDDGREVLTAYRASRAYPFVIVVSLDKEGGLTAWREEAARTAIVLATMLAAAFALAGWYFVRMERAARQHDADVTQLRLRGAALEAAANAIIITDRQGAIEWANPAFCALSGYTMAETLGRNPGELIRSGRQPPETYQELWSAILAGKVWRGEMINRRKDATLYLEDQTITPVKDDDGEVRHFVAVKNDITERKQAERRMEELSRHLVVVQESARRRLSGELHDRTSPNLAAIEVNLDTIATLLAGQSPILLARLEDVRALIEDTTASIREICSDLRPPVLDYAGLRAALESYIKQFQRRTGIVVDFRCTERAARPSPALESVLFRIVQEALTNAAKHARAANVVVTLDLERDPASLTVKDDGIGFDPDALGATTHTSGLGILTMREMSEFSGGRFTLESAPGSGTRITVELDAMEERT